MATYVLVHGAWHGGWSWQRVVPILEAAGHRVLAPTLDGCAERRGALRPGITVDTQAAELADLFFFEDLRDVVFVATSVGGMVMCKAAEQVRERIGRLVFMDAIAMFDGEQRPDALGRPTSVVSELAIANTPEHSRHLFRNLDPETREWALQRVTPQPIGVLTQKMNLPAFWQQRWKASVIWCRQAPNPGEAHLRRCQQALGAAWHEIDDAHYPMLSSPGELSRLLMIE